MDWSSILTPICAFLAALVGGWFSLKNKKLELLGTKKEDLEKCRDAHTTNLNKVKGEFDMRLDEIDDKVSEINDSMIELKALYQNMAAMLEMVSTEVKEAIRVGNENKTDIAVLNNREKVSEHRLDDLERHEETKKN